MAYVITASGRVIVDRPIDQARMLVELVPPEVLDKVLRFVLDGGRGSVVMTVRERAVAGVRIDAIVM